MRPSPTTKKLLVSLLILAAVAATVIGAASAGLAPEQRPSRHRLMDRHQRRRAVFSLENAALGATTTRSVTASNSGTAPGALHDEGEG